MGAMDRGLRERVRWGNVALALAVAAVLALVVAWPLLAPDAPAVPGPRAVPRGDAGGAAACRRGGAAFGAARGAAAEAAGGAARTAGR